MSGSGSPSSGSEFTEDMLYKKYYTVFQWWDMNGDGWVTKDDVDKMADNFTRLADEADKKNQGILRTGIFDWWRALLSVKGREDQTSGKLGEKEFIRSLRAFRDDSSQFKPALNGVIDGIFGALDQDGNGVLTEQEYVRLYEVLGLPGTLGMEIFKRIDANNNGEADHEELREAFFEFYLSPDPNARGQWLFGPPTHFE